jgi:hypothetical protein
LKFLSNLLYARIGQSIPFLIMHWQDNNMGIAKGNKMKKNKIKMDKVHYIKYINVFWYDLYLWWVLQLIWADYSKREIRSVTCLIAFKNLENNSINWKKHSDTWHWVLRALGPMSSHEDYL